jgi:hypothetical protein
MRTGRITQERLEERSPGFAAAYETYMTARRATVGGNEE